MNVIKYLIFHCFFTLFWCFLFINFICKINLDTDFGVNILAQMAAFDGEEINAMFLFYLPFFGTDLRHQRAAGWNSK